MEQQQHEHLQTLAEDLMAARREKASLEAGVRAVTPLFELPNGDGSVAAIHYFEQVESD